MTSPKTIARVAGFLYLAMTLFSAFGLVVQSRVVVPGDAATTADNIRASVTLFRVGIVSGLISNVGFLLTAMALYVLLRHVNQLAAAAMVTFVAVSVAIGYLDVLNDYAMLTIATGAQYTAAFGRAGSDGLVALFRDVGSAGGAINEMFWGLWLLPLGYLVMKSGYFPGLLGALLVVAGFSWIAQFFTGFLTLGAGGAEAFLAIGASVEFLFIGWLLVRSASTPVSETSAPAIATAVSGGVGA